MFPSLRASDDSRLIVASPRCLPFAECLIDKASRLAGVAIARPKHMCQLLTALCITHTKLGLVHRDLAPGNFFLHPMKQTVRVFVLMN